MVLELPAADSEPNSDWLGHELLDVRGRHEQPIDASTCSLPRMATIIPNRDDNDEALRPKCVRALMGRGYSFVHPDDWWHDSTTNEQMLSVLEQLEQENDVIVNPIGALRDQKLPAPRFVLAGAVMYPVPAADIDGTINDIVDDVLEENEWTEAVTVVADGYKEDAVQFYFPGTGDEQQERPELLRDGSNYSLSE